GFDMCLSGREVYAPGGSMRTSVLLGAVLLLSTLLSTTLSTTGMRAQAPQAPAGGRGAQPGLEPRIVTFEARPATVRAGEPVVLVWQTENPGGVSIAPDVGTVTARGTKTVTPSATTT